jgi:hypothetical protein
VKEIGHSKVHPSAFGVLDAGTASQCAADVKLANAVSLVALLGGVAWAETDTQVASLEELHRHHQHGGITQFVELALDTLGEDSARRPQVEALQGELHTCLEPVEAQEESVLLALAEGVAGTLDPAKVTERIAQLKTTAETIHSCVAGPLNSLHQLLTKAERAELAEKVRAHWAVWRRVNHDADLAGREKGSRLSELAIELNLTADQVAKSATALKALKGASFDAEQVQKQVLAFATAFAGEKFDATSVTTNSTAFLASHGATRMSLFYQTLVPGLTAEQRATLAAHLREHAQHHRVEP